MTKPFTDEAKEKLYEAYEDVRRDKTDTRWCLAKYPDGGKLLEMTGTGVDYGEFLASLEDDQRAFGYVRFETGDELSKRAKFVFITWIGPAVAPLKKARVSTDKAFIKQIFNMFAVEFLTDDRGDLREERVKAKVVAASGAHYGTGR